MASDFDRQGGYSSAYLRATDPISAEALKNRVSDDQRLKLEGVLEKDYYAKQTSSGAPIKVIGIVVGFIMAIGSIFAAMKAATQTSIKSRFGITNAAHSLPGRATTIACARPHRIC